MDTPQKLTENLLQINASQLPPETLNELIKHFILREGTDYGAQEITLDTKIEQVQEQIKKGETLITYDIHSESCTLMTKEKLKQIISSQA